MAVYSNGMDGRSLLFPRISYFSQVYNDVHEYIHET